MRFESIYTSNDYPEWSAELCYKVIKRSRYFPEQAQIIFDMNFVDALGLRECKYVNGLGLIYQKLCEISSDKIT